MEGVVPVVDPSADVHPTAVLIGNVIAGPGASLRGDFGRTVLQRGVNLQDTCVIHGFPADDTVVMDEAEVGERAIVAACAFVPAARAGTGERLGADTGWRQRATANSFEGSLDDARRFAAFVDKRPPPWAPAGGA